MSKTSFGKLAIGVVALSSSVLVHAGVRDTLVGTQVGFDVDAVALTKDKELRLPTELVGARVHFATPSLVSAYGPLGVQIAGGIGYLHGGESLHSSVITVPTENLVGDLPRSSNEISGIAASAGVKVSYAINNSIKGLLDLQGGAVSPIKNALRVCPFVAPSFGLQYNFNASHAGEATFKYTHFFDQSVKGFGSFNAGYKYTI